MAAGVAIADFAGAILRIPLAFRLASADIAARYQRTVLGPLWLTLGQAAGVVGFVLLFSQIFQTDDTSYPIYLAAGIPVFALITSFLADMPTSFIAAKGYLEAYDMPWLVHVFRRAFTYLIVFFHQMVVYVVLMAIMDVPLTPLMAYAPLGLLIVMVGGTGIGLFFAVVASRYRDVTPLLSVVTSFMFVFTPVFWSRANITANTFIVELNPIYYALEIIRRPLLGQAVPQEFWMGTSIGAGVCLTLGLAAFAIGRRRLYHWI
jgi:ABC-type polysaccharide/polyol phosphate export permease